MKAMLTSSLGGSAIVNGKRVPSALLQRNGLLDSLKSIWTPGANVLIICADPDSYDQNDGLCDCLKDAFSMSGLSVSHIDKCDNRNRTAVEDLGRADVLVLAGGHVPTENTFMKELRLRQRLETYHGIVVAWSAGSMNSADMVYASPELAGEAIDPLYVRWIPGLGLTDINMIPHFQSLRSTCLDGLRLIEDITYPDSVGHSFLALNDGSYLLIDGETTTLYGEAYLIQDGQMRQICKDGESLALS